MNGRTLSLSAYRALTLRIPPVPAEPPCDRPSGALVWIHAGLAADLPALADLSRRIAQVRADASVLLTCPPEDRAALPATGGADRLIACMVPDEHPRSVAAFLDHWKPDLALWVWGGLRPNLIDETARRKVPLRLIAAEAQGFDGRRERWLPELARQMVRCFGAATARSPGAVDRLIALGMPRGAVSIQPELTPSGRLLPCIDSDLDELSARLKGRPVWTAARVQPQEWPQVIRAHRKALRSAHRLLLVLNPAGKPDRPELCGLLEEHDLAYAIWGDGEWPNDTTQVLVADIEDELGLWYRLASVSFMGGSLAHGATACDPLEAAALGTAILYGPNLRPHLTSFSRLASAGAARIVNDWESLGNAVTRLIAPDQSAQMAHAGWAVVTEGAEVVDSIIEMVQDGLDDPRSTAYLP